MDARTPIEHAPPGHRWFARAVLGFDAWLRRRNGVYEYSNHPHCAFRMQIARVRQEILLADGTHLHPGDRVIELHIWNEQFPCFSAGGATLSWGRQINRRVDTSLRELARHLAAAPDLADIRAIRADTRLAGTATTAQLLRICRRYGLERGPDLGAPSLIEWCRRLGENIFIALLVLARNAGAFRPESIWRDRVQMFLSRADLERRYGTPQKLAGVGNSTCERLISVPQSTEPSPSLAPDCGDPSTLARQTRRGTPENAEHALSRHINSAR
jgi:hypothetical protein